MKADTNVSQIDRVSLKYLYWNNYKPGLSESLNHLALWSPWNTPLLTRHCMKFYLHIQLCCSCFLQSHEDGFCCFIVAHSKITVLQVNTTVVTCSITLFRQAFYTNHIKEASWEQVPIYFIYYIKRSGVIHVVATTEFNARVSVNWLKQNKTIVWRLESSQHFIYWK